MPGLSRMNSASATVPTVRWPGSKIRTATFYRFRDADGLRPFTSALTPTESPAANRCDWLEHNYRLALAIAALPCLQRATQSLRGARDCESRRLQEGT